MLRAKTRLRCMKIQYHTLPPILLSPYLKERNPRKVQIPCDARQGFVSLISTVASSRSCDRTLVLVSAVVIEDNRVNRLIAERLLRRMGHIVVMAEDGALGLKAVIEADPVFDLILTDCQMPVMDGVRLAFANTTRTCNQHTCSYQHYRYSYTRLRLLTFINLHTLLSSSTQQGRFGTFLIHLDPPSP